MKKWLGLGAGALLAVGCSQQKTVARVDDSGLARLNENQMQPVDDARIEEGRAQDAVARARANEADARARLEVAKSEKDVSDAQLKRSLAEKDLLKKQYASADQMTQADQQIRAAQDRVKATDYKLQYLSRMISVAETERKAAEAHVATAHALTEQAKYRAERAGNVPQAAAVNAGDIEQQLAQARTHEAELQKAAAEQRSDAIALYNKWEQADSSARSMTRPETLPVPPPVSEPGK